MKSALVYYIYKNGLKGGEGHCLITAGKKDFKSWVELCEYVIEEVGKEKGTNVVIKNFIKLDE